MPSPPFPVDGYEDLVELAAATGCGRSGWQRLALHELLPTSELHVIPRGTRALAHEHPDQVAALIRRHVAAPAV